MEHLTDINYFSSRTGINDPIILKKLIDYASLIHSENFKYNLTGHKSLPEIIENLIIGSLEPIININVPRGTLFADIGTGSGIPGIPISLKHQESEGILFDSNNKKIHFIKDVLFTLDINNTDGIHARIEEAGRNAKYRSSFDIVFTRAMSDIYTIAELASPLLKKGGFAFLYINKSQMSVGDYVIKHLVDLGLSPEPLIKYKNNPDIETFHGLILYKENNTDDKYPRRMAVIKRMATR